MSRALDSATLALEGQHLIEASAGTGKTYNIALLYLRLLLERKFSVREIAVVTFTEAATRELRARVRARIAEAIARLGHGETRERDPLDHVLGRYRVDSASTERATNLLSAALAGFDEARISTLHGVCRQWLAEHAFEAGLPFFELENDAGNEAAQELVRDFWRQRVVAEADAAVDAVLERWDSPQALAADLLRSQVLALPAARIDPVDAQGWVERSVAALATACERWVVVHADGRVPLALQQLQDAVTAKFLKSAKDTPLGASAMDRCRDACAGHPAQVDVAALASLRASSIDAARSEKAKKANWAVPAELAEVASCAEALHLASQARQSALLALFTADAIEYVRRGLAVRRERLRRFGFDDLIGELHERLHGAAGEGLARAIAAAVPALLVDEFQDTDPLQYAILRRVHRARTDAVMLLIGDPKQAIYRFRGGDIHTYHAAARDAGDNRHTLRENWRSDAALIEASNAVFEGVDDPFLVDFIAFEPAQFPLAKPDDRHWLASDAPLTLWRLPDRIEKEKPKPWTAPAFSERILVEVCSAIGKLLAEARERGQPAPSIAVLVHSNRLAEKAARQLAQWSIACDYLSAASVFASDEALELERLLGALDAPADAARVRAALATELLGKNLPALLEARDDLALWEAQLAEIASLRQRWIDAGAYATIAHCVQAAACRLLPRWDGRRRITNLLHLAELLQQESARRPTAKELLHWLGQRRTEADEKRGAGNAEQLRPADDPGAVQVLTVHRSKGLQYDVVFAPFAMGTFWKRVENLERADESVSWHAGDELRIDIGGPQWQAHALAQRDEQFAESLRLAYVAITRARHRVWLAWAWTNTGRTGTSLTGPFSWLWFRAPGMVHPEQLAGLKDSPELIDAGLDRLVARAAGRVRTEALEIEAPAVEPLADDVDGVEPVVSEFRGHIERRLETLSYSRLFGGGQHAPLADHDEVIDDAVTVSLQAVADPVPQWPRGAAFGNCLHQVFEDVAFSELAGAGLHADLVRICADHGYAGEDVETIARMARAGVRTELVADSGLRLMELKQGESLAELEFLFPLGGARLDAFARLLEPHSPYGRARGELVARRSSVRGLMTGFIDLVLRWRDRYYVVDYKSNLLGASRGDYAVDRLPAAIRAHNYDLQYLIYLVALQRFLRTRLGDRYDYERHVGGALYLFVRGMREGDLAGIHHDRPPAALIDALEAWCEGGSE